MFKVGKQYNTLTGAVFTVRYISDNEKSKYPVWAEDEDGNIQTFTKDEWFDIGSPNCRLNLILPDDPSTLKKDDPIMVKFNYKKDEWVPRYFSHIDTNGEVCVYVNGTTSWTAVQKTIEVNEWRKPTPEEMPKQ